MSRKRKKCLGPNPLLLEQLKDLERYYEGRKRSDVMLGMISRTIHPVIGLPPSAKDAAFEQLMEEEFEKMRQLMLIPPHLMSDVSNSTYSTTAAAMPTTDDILDTIEKLRAVAPPLPRRQYIVCHPSNLHLLGQWAASSDRFPNLIGLPVYTNEACPLRTKKWEFPKERFVEYEKSDEAWAIPLGFGRWVDDGAYFAVVSEPEKEMPQWEYYKRC